MKRTVLQRTKELLLTVPSLSWLSIFFVLPTAIIATFCCRSANTLDGSLNPGWDIQGVAAIFCEPHTYVILVRTLWLSLLATTIAVVLSLPVVYHMALLPKQRQYQALLLVLLPFWSSFLVRIFAWKTLLHPEGFVHYLFTVFGLISENTSLLYNNVAVVLVMVSSYLPFAILPLYTSASKFNFQLIEAACDLGATRRQAFFSVFLPYMKGSLVTASIMILIPLAGAYVIPDVVGGVDSEMLGTTISQSVFVERNIPEASIYSFLLMAVLAVQISFLTRFQHGKSESSS